MRRLGESVHVEVVYALPQEQRVVRLEVPQGTTIEAAIELSGVLDRYPQINLATDPVGIFGQLRALADGVRSGDRIEIYRPLRADPREARRRRARQR